MNQDCKQFFDKSKEYTHIDNELFASHNVKKGLRNDDGTGVCIGLTKIADVIGYRKEQNVKIDTLGELYYRGIEIRELIQGYERYGYEKTCFLILFGYLPDKAEFEKFKTCLSSQYHVQDEFILRNIRSIPTSNLMNKLQQMVLMLYIEDDKPDDIDPYETLCKGLSILAKLPSLLCYGYYSKYSLKDEHFIAERSAQSMAENILYLIREDHKFTKQEAKILDIILMLHADHGGGNNSTFTNVVISSSGSDIYSTMAASIASMKGSRHGGANIQVTNMMDEIINTIGYTEHDDDIKDILYRLLNKDFYDGSGLIYGIGHAIYTLSDPRSEVLKTYAKQLATEKNCLHKYLFYERLEKCAKEVIFETKGVHVSSNVDFYSGFVYDLLKIPQELYTPIFVCSRMIGWLAHNIENKLYDGRIMRPATKYVGNSNKEGK